MSKGRDNVPASDSGKHHAADKTGVKPPRTREFGGPAGPEPTRYGDWEKDGRCSDF